LGPARAWYSDKLFRVDEEILGGVPVGILQLNSAWASGPSDGEQGLLLGEVQLREALEQTADTTVRVALVHHPMADLREFDQDKAEGLLGAPGGAHFLLRGHRHKGKTVDRATPDGKVLELAAGAAYTSGRWPRGFLETEIDLAEGRARVEFFEYAESGRGFWAKDSKVYENSPDGVATFDLPEELRLGEKAPEPEAAPLSEARREGLTARYRRAAAAMHGTVRFIGIGDPRRTPNVRVPELFVPLKLRVERQGEKEQIWETGELLERLIKSNKRGGRVVVLGDPGSGKTTLCRYAAVVLAGEAKLEGLEVPETLVPLFLPFREYVRQCREEGDRGVLAFLEEQAGNHLQVSLPEGFLEAKLESGEAAVLLDGLDEVGSAKERADMRERVLAFERLYPKTPILVTSRIAGYESASLPRRGESSAFTHTRIDPFGDEDLHEFGRHWYVAQEPDDPVARNRGTADLLAALEADPRVRELAHTPMLATQDNDG